MAPEVLPVLALVLVVALIFSLMALGWRNRRRRQSALAIAEFPSGLETPLLDVGILYVATTTAGDPLDRIALPGLAYRSRGRVLLWPQGAGFALTGEKPVFIPRESIIAVGSSTWTIDKVVENGGLIRIDWNAPSASGSRGVESYFRVLQANESERVVSALQSIVPAQVQASAAHGDPSIADETEGKA